MTAEKRERIMSTRAVVLASLGLGALAGCGSSSSSSSQIAPAATTSTPTVTQTVTTVTKTAPASSTTINAPDSSTTTSAPATNTGNGSSGGGGGQTVPGDLVGKKLNDAEDELDSQGIQFSVDSDGHVVILRGDWGVCSTTPGAGQSISGAVVLHLGHFSCGA